jgi:hypothetical protein
MSRQSLVWVGALAAIVCAAISPAAAQDSTNGTGSSQSSPVLTGGWTFTPTMVYSGGWDDNVLVRGQGDEAPGDFVNILNPRAQADFKGRRGQLSGSYDGAFLLYSDLNTLNSYDQHGSFLGRRLITPRVALFAQNSFASAPTTELSQLVGVPFTRTGSQIDDLHGGVEWALSKRNSLNASYHFSWVSFDQGPDFSTFLRGGHSQGGLVAFRRRLSARATLTADYDLAHALVEGGSQSFDVTNSAGGVVYKFSDLFQISGAVGVARLFIEGLGQARTGPVYHAGLTRRFQTAALDVTYDRSFVPSFGFGGTTQNKELTTRFHVSLSRRWFASSSVSWRSNDPLILGDPSLRSWWTQASVGYDVQPWVRIEGFYAGTRQTIDQPGGLMNRNRLGFQIITVKPVRIR